ncbi:hypothetical protein D2A34_01955 [Clostridium chromiireducens]|uniref:Uncharacterized protein n=1 Tax=Clostridium chromiireducens TaxID=225345 RepID=A0A399IX74_9CLOT|nr:hypothetical protein [Clostridium chromiireducens]RII36162.1 hypothetical protein D2A34_01955 [Clostridium chromiireducens]
MPLILLIIGLVLIVYSYRAIKLEDKKEQYDDSVKISFRSVLEDNKEELNDYKMEIGILRRDIAESLTELQEEILDMKINMNLIKKSEETYENREDIESINYLNETENNIININSEENNYEIEKSEEENNITDNVDENLSLDLSIKDGIISEIDFSRKMDSNKTQKIKELINQGLTEEEICHKLSVSKGEVLLVKGLFKK